MFGRVVDLSPGTAFQAPEPVHEYTMGRPGGLQLVVWSYGARIVELRLPLADGSTLNLVKRFATVAEYSDASAAHYMGATMGRFARCIGSSRFLLDSTPVELVPNLGPHHFHGGEVGFDGYVWSASTGLDPAPDSVRFSLVSPDGDQGYPGEVRAVVTYTLDEPDRLRIDFHATTTRTTVIGLTNHAYWNLAGSGTIDDHRLWLGADQVVSTDRELIPVGPPLPVRDTGIDFRSGRAIGTTPIDHCFLLSGRNPAATLSSPRSGVSMDVSTNQPGLALHSGDSLKSAPRQGLCVQTGPLPDAPNRPDFPAAVLAPGAVYHHWVEYRFHWPWAPVGPGASCHPTATP